RRMPLSKGRITEDGYLQCAYHGWCFDGATGQCARIPNLKPTETVKSNVRVTAFATLEGLVDAGGWSLRTGVAPAVGPPPGRDAGEGGTTMWDARLPGGFVRIGPGGAVPARGPGHLAGPPPKPLLHGRFEVRAPHALVKRALLWHPGRVLSLGPLFG